MSSTKTVEELNELTVKDLKELAKELGITLRGRKAEMIEQIISHQASVTDSNEGDTEAQPSEPAETKGPEAVPEVSPALAEETIAENAGVCESKPEPADVLAKPQPEVVELIPSQGQSSEIPAFDQLLGTVAPVEAVKTDAPESVEDVNTEKDGVAEVEAVPVTAPPEEDADIDTAPSPQHGAQSKKRGRAESEAEAQPEAAVDEPALQTQVDAQDDPAPTKRSRPETANDGDDADILTSVLYEDPAEQEPDAKPAPELPPPSVEAKPASTSEPKPQRHVSGSALTKIREEVVQATQNPSMPAAVVAALTKKNPRPPIVLKSAGSKGNTGVSGVTSPRTAQGLGSPNAGSRTVTHVPEPKIEPTNTLRIDGLVRPCKLDEITELMESDGRALVDNGLWLDPLRTHCYATFETVEMAVAGRKSMYGLHWQPFSKKTLTVEFSEQTAQEIGSSTTAPKRVVVWTPPPEAPVKPAALAKPEPPKKVIRLYELFSKTATEPPLYFKVNSKAVVDAAREVNAKRGGPIFVPEAQLPGNFRRGPPRGPRGGLDRQWGGVPRR